MAQQCTRLLRVVFGGTRNLRLRRRQVREALLLPRSFVLSVGTPARKREKEGEREKEIIEVGSGMYVANYHTRPTNAYSNAASSIISDDMRFLFFSKLLHERAVVTKTSR